MTVRPIAISTLSPVHIGCDEVYEPSNFVIADGLLHALDPAALASCLTDKEHKQLAALADEREPIGALQRFFRDNAERFAMLATHQVVVTEAIVAEYLKSAGRATQRGPAGEATYNLFPIARTAFRPFDNVPYLPGSSLKGSIRTAWLNRCNGGKPLTGEEQRDKRGAPRRLQERLLGYAAGKFENDPFRHIGLADAHPETGGMPPPTRVLYAISKKKRQPREDERGSPELKVFLETIPEAIPVAFQSELRIADRPDSRILWDALCDACNGFYGPQFEAELGHPVLGGLLDAEWKRLVTELLGNELRDLIAARQGLLLRVGRHSGAESVTLNGVRDIKILGPRVDGKQTSDFRPNTTEKRFASLTKAGGSSLLPFGWIWIDAHDGAHGHVSESLRQRLATHSEELRQAHRDRMVRLEESQRQRLVAEAAAERQRLEVEAAAQAEARAQAAREARLASLSPNRRRIEEFIAAFAIRVEQLHGRKERLHADYHGRARKLAQEASDRAIWTIDERRAAADAIDEWLPKVVEKIDKEQLKKLGLSALRAP